MLPRDGLRSLRASATVDDKVAVELDQGLPVAGAAGCVADRVHVSDRIGQSDLGVEARGELDELGVDGRTRVAEDLDVPLQELPVAAAGTETPMAEVTAVPMATMAN